MSDHLKELEGKLGARVPADYAAFLQWHRAVDEPDCYVSSNPEYWGIRSLCRIGFGVSHITLAPLSRDPWETLGVDDPVRVYYLRYYPNIAVRHRGPDWIMSLGLALLAVILLFVAGRVASWEHPPGDALKGRRTKRARP